MPEQRTELDADTVALLASVHDRTPLDPAVMVADGHGVKLTVRRGQLRVEHGTGPARTERTLPRVQREVRRIIVLGDTGYPSIDAARWCADTGVTVVMADREGRAIGTLGAPAPEDARLTRAQAFAGEGGPFQAAGLQFVKSVLAVKLAGQADIAENVLRQPGIAAVIREHAAALDNAGSALEAMGFEGAAAAEYWNAWNGSVEVPFTGKEAEKVPLEWTVFQWRESVVSGKPRHATDPVNAMLNYAYRLAEAECRIACLTYGLDPGMGFLHVDKMGRDSLALDLMEAVRPHVDRFVLRLLGYAAPGEEADGRTFTAEQFTETRDGVCRLVAPLTHEIAEQAGTWAAVVGEHAAALRRTLAALASGDVPPVPKTDRATVRPLAAVSSRPAGRGPPHPPDARPGRRPRAAAPAARRPPRCPPRPRQPTSSLTNSGKPSGRCCPHPARPTGPTSGPICGPSSPEPCARKFSESPAVTSRPHSEPTARPYAPAYDAGRQTPPGQPSATSWTTPPTCGSSGPPHPGQPPDLTPEADS